MGAHDSLLRRHKQVMPSWLALYYETPIALARGEGCWVWDAEGEKYLDLFGGILTTMGGHAIPEVVDAVREQAGRILHSSTLYLIEQQIELAERIAELAPVPDAKVFFTTSGTEATDAALMLATCYRRSGQVLAMRNSYHGRSFAAVGVTGNRGWSASALSPLQVHYVHGANRHQGPLAGLPDDEYIDACVEDLRDVIATATAGDVACLMAEPIQGVGGFTMPPDGMYGRMKEVLDESGILFIADEVQTGWGRTGDNFWGIDAHGVAPDIMTFAKGLGDGLAIGGVVARGEIMDSLPGNSISTFGGNPLSCAGALAHLDYVLANDLQRNSREQGNHMRERLAAETADMGIVAEVRGRGLMIAVELCDPGTTTPAGTAASMALEQCRERGLLIGKGGLHGNVLRIAPPLSITREQVDLGVDGIVDALATVQAQVGGTRAASERAGV